MTVIDLSEKRLERRLNEYKSSVFNEFLDLAKGLNEQSAQDYLNVVIEPLVRGQEEEGEIKVPLKAKFENGQAMDCIATFNIVVDSIEIVPTK